MRREQDYNVIIGCFCLDLRSRAASSNTVLLRTPTNRHSAGAVVGSQTVLVGPILVNLPPRAQRASPPEKQGARQMKQLRGGKDRQGSLRVCAHAPLRAF